MEVDPEIEENLDLAIEVRVEINVVEKIADATNLVVVWVEKEVDVAVVVAVDDHDDDLDDVYVA